MAYHCKKALKDGLLAAGKWAEAVRMMEDVKAQTGCADYLAMRKAVEMVAPDLIELVGLKKRGNTPELAEVDRIRMMARARMISQANGGGGTRSKGGDGIEIPNVMITKGTFERKECGGAAAIDWAFTNLNTVDVMPDDAPSAVAWNLLAEMRSNQSIRADVIGKWLTSSLKMGEKDDSSARRFDGESEYDINAAIAGMASARDKRESSEAGG